MSLDISKILPKGNWTENAIRVFEERYLLLKPDGTRETPDELCWRVACALAEAEDQYDQEKKTENISKAKWAERFYNLMVSRKFLPNSPCLANAGTNTGKQFSACYVLNIEDCLHNGEDGIFDTISTAAQIHSSGGGVGYSFSKLRPAGSKVNGGAASGPISFMRIFDAATQEIKQAGQRRGANMGVLDADHPDIEKFITCKIPSEENKNPISNFNISVGASDAFMRAVKEDGSIFLYHEKDIKPGEIEAKSQSIRARDIWDKIIDAAWATADPGLLFLDRANNSLSNPIPEIEVNKCTNPCGEVFLGPWDSCNLGSINLSQFISDNDGGKDVDFYGIDEAARVATRMLDNMITVNPYPMKQIEEKTLSLRRIGVGVMGWADLLIALEIPYDSVEALDLARKVMSTINNAANACSEELAIERGAFPLCNQSRLKDRPRRNATVTIIAPTGTISILAGCSSGIEPLFAVEYTHNNQLGREMDVNASRSGYEKMVDERGKEAADRIYRTAHDIHYSYHILMQTAFQEFTDNSVSKTINLPHDATREDISNAYMMAYDKGCKGITVYRDGCKSVQVLNLKKKEESESIAGRPRKLSGETYRVETPVGTAYVTINFDEDRNPVECFLNVGKAGTDTAAISEAFGRLISMILRMPSKMPVQARLQEVMDQLTNIGGSGQVGLGPRKVRSLPDGLSKCLGEFLGIGVAETNGKSKGKIGDLCPRCNNATLVHQEGCESCGCGYSKC